MRASTPRDRAVLLRRRPADRLLGRPDPGRAAPRRADERAARAGAVRRLARRARGDAARRPALRADRQPQRHPRRRCCSAAARCSPPRSRPASPGSPRRSSASAPASARSTSPSTPRGSRSSGSPAPDPLLVPRRVLGRRARRRGHGALVAAAGSAAQLHYGAARASSPWSAPSAVRYLLPPEADDRPRSARALRPAAAGDPRPRRGGVLHMLAEGAAVDWSAVYLSRSFGAAAGVAALAYTAFSLVMTTSRAIGDRLNRRLGPVDARPSGGAVATIGLGLALVDRLGARRDRRLRRDGRGPRRRHPGPLPRRRVDAGRLGERRCRRRLDDRLVRLPRRPAGDRVRGLGRRAARGPRDRRPRDAHARRPSRATPSPGAARSASAGWSLARARSLGHRRSS